MQQLRNHYLILTISQMTTYWKEQRPHWYASSFRPPCNGSTKVQVTNTEIGTPGASEMRMLSSGQRGVKVRVVRYSCFALVSGAVSWLCVDHLGLTGEIRSGKAHVMARVVAGRRPGCPRR